MNKNQKLLLGGLLLAGVVLGAVILLNRGYGEVSPQAYQYSKALYSACQSKNEVHLEKIEQMLEGSASEPISDTERGWIESIVSQARDGQWRNAAKKARRIMEDQVKY